MERDGLFLTITINLRDGGEYNDVEAHAADLNDVPNAIRRALDSEQVDSDEWSSLVVVVVS